MRRHGIIVGIAAASIALAGCALRDTRYDYAYSGASDGLWGDAPPELIDWNFPTSRNQGPLEGPKRIQLERTAIGVTWATRNPLPLSDNVVPRDTPSAETVQADDSAARPQGFAGAGSGAVGSTAPARERGAAR